MKKFILFILILCVFGGWFVNEVVPKLLPWIVGLGFLVCIFLFLSLIVWANSTSFGGREPWLWLIPGLVIIGIVIWSAWRWTSVSYQVIIGIGAGMGFVLFMIWVISALFGSPPSANYENEDPKPNNNQSKGGFSPQLQRENREELAKFVREWREAYGEMPTVGEMGSGADIEVFEQPDTHRVSIETRDGYINGYRS